MHQNCNICDTKHQHIHMMTAYLFKNSLFFAGNYWQNVAFYGYVAVTLVNISIH